MRYIAEDQDDDWVEFAEKPNDSKYPAEVIGEENDTQEVPAENKCCRLGFHIDLTVIRTFEIIVKTGLKCLISYNI